LKPAEEPRIWQIVIVDSDGSRKDGPEIAWRPQKRGNGRAQPRADS